MDGAAESAAADCDESLRLRPNDAFAFDSRGIIHLSLSQIDNAIADFDAALTIFPKFASPLYGRGIAKLKKGDVGAGNADINAAKAIRPDIDKDFVRYGTR